MLKWHAIICSGRRCYFSFCLACGKFVARPADLLSGENLRLLGDVVLDKRNGLGENRFPWLLREAVGKVKPSASFHPTQPVVNAPSYFEVCAHVLVRRGTMLLRRRTPSFSRVNFQNSCPLR